MPKRPCFFYRKGRCGECANCILFIHESAEAKILEKIANCKTRHCLQEVIQLEENIFKKGYGIGKGVIDQIIKGPIKFQCVECGIIFNFYGVTWKGFEMEIHPELGVAATYLEEDNIPQSMLTDYFEMKLFEVEKNITNPPLKKRRFRKRGNPSSNEWKKKLEEMNNFNQAQLDLIITQFKEKSEQLVKARHLRGKKLPATLAKINDFAEYVELKKIEHHNGGITAMDMQGDLILTCGLDLASILYDIGEDKVENSYMWHQTRINCCIFDNGRIITGGDKINMDIFGEIYSIGVHKKEILDISLHPTKFHVLTTANDGFWSLIDLDYCRTLTKVKYPSNETLNVCKFHPDGKIFGTGGQGEVVKMWSINDLKCAAASLIGHKDSIVSMAYSENGYYMATGSKDGEIIIWDLRTQSNIESIEIDQSMCLSFDNSGKYLAIGSSAIELYETKHWKKIGHLSEHTDIITQIKFGPDAKFIVSTSLDSTIRLFGLKRNEEEEIVTID